MSFANKLIELKESLERKRASLLHTRTVDSDFVGCSVYLFAFEDESTPYEVAKRSSSSSTTIGVYYIRVVLSVLLSSTRSQ